MIRNPIDVSISPELARFISDRLNNPEIEEPVTLGSIRRFLASVLPEEYRESESLHHIGGSAPLVDEIDGLIEQFGEEMNAADLLEEEASEALSRLIQASMEESENPPTLHDVKEALFSGLAARLVAEGALEEDEDETLNQEIEDLAARFGEDALAERFLRYE